MRLLRSPAFFLCIFPYIYQSRTTTKLDQDIETIHWSINKTDIEDMGSEVPAPQQKLYVEGRTK